MKEPICIIHNDKFTISFKTTNQMFYHLYRLLTQYGDEISLTFNDIDFLVDIFKEENNE